MINLPRGSGDIPNMRNKSRQLKMSEWYGNPKSWIFRWKQRAGIYAIKLSSSHIKVGCSSDVGSRLQSHLTNSKAYGVEVLDAFAVETAYYRSAEKVLIESCENAGGSQLTAETFSGLDWSDVVTWLSLCAEEGYQLHRDFMERRRAA